MNARDSAETWTLTESDAYAPRSGEGEPMALGCEAALPFLWSGAEPGAGDGVGPWSAPPAA